MALASLLMGEACPSDIAMTGELTLQGHVLPVGGIKVRAAQQTNASRQTVAREASLSHRRRKRAQSRGRDGVLNSSKGRGTSHVRRTPRPSENSYA